MFTPLEDHNVKDGARVGVVSVGGLGHLGIQFARARACRVTAFSTSPTKEAESREMGASDFVVMTDPDTGSISGIKSMLRTAAKKSVRPMIERHAMSDVNTAIDRVRRIRFGIARCSSHNKERRTSTPPLTIFVASDS